MKNEKKSKPKKSKEMKNSKKIGIIGLGYVGLPLAVEFGKIRETIGYDINKKRINELINGYDHTKEVEQEELKKATQLKLTDNVSELKDCQIYIITVPTPITRENKPDLRPILNASRDVGGMLKNGDIVIYESTVYPGLVEEECVKVLSEVSGLEYGTEYYCGYSPERINPGDKTKKLKDIKKITSGTNELIADEIDYLYKQIIEAGTYKASSIAVAEAAKVIENTQRDLNIALMNELSFIFKRLKIDTTEVLEAAGTKWNFHHYSPGMVGGHCIGVDPYYLTYKAEIEGYYPEIILSGRRVNNNVPKFIAHEIIKGISNQGKIIKGAKIAVLGFTFKEDCPDIRNTRVIELIQELEEYGCEVVTHDPQASIEDVKEEYGIEIKSRLEDIKNQDAIVIAVKHKEYLKSGIKAIKKIGDKSVLVYDIKSAFSKKDTEWRL